MLASNLNAATDLKMPLSVPSGKHLVWSLNAGESMMVKDNRDPSIPELLQTTPLHTPVSIKEPGVYGSGDLPTATSHLWRSTQSSGPPKALQSSSPTERLNKGTS